MYIFRTIQEDRVTMFHAGYQQQQNVCPKTTTTINRLAAESQSVNFTQKRKPYGCFHVLLWSHMMQHSGKQISGWESIKTLHWFRSYKTSK